MIHSLVILINISCKKTKTVIGFYEKVIKVQSEAKHRHKAYIFQKASWVAKEVIFSFPKSPVEIFRAAKATELSNVHWLSMSRFYLLVFENFAFIILEAVDIEEIYDHESPSHSF